MNPSSKPSQCDAITDTSNDEGNVVDVDVTSSSSEGKTVNHFDSKDLILQFTKMNVAPPQQQKQQQQQHRHVKALPSSNATSSSTTATSATSIKKVTKNWRFKAKPESKQLQPPFRFVLRPSKLNLDKTDPESLFRDFSAACSKELDSIARFDPESRREPTKKKKKSKSDPANVPVHLHHLKRRKASSCAEQARQMSNDELSDTIDILADFLEESIVFPKKMSYMAELMYT
jgi:hypothetical protein